MNTEQYFKISNSDIRLLDTQDEKTYKCYTSNKNGGVKFIKITDVPNKDNISKYKVFLTSASGSKESIGDLGRRFVGYPFEVSSRSFVHFAFDNLSNCESLISYLNTTFVKNMVRVKKQTQIVSKNCFELVPLIPFDREWTDEKLFDYFNLTEEERDLILNYDKK